MNYLETKFAPPFVVLVFGVGMWGVAQFPTQTIEFNPVLKYSAVGVLALVGVLFLILGITSFRRVRTTINPLKPEAATSLVTSGVYQITRNPMYVGFAMLLCAWAVYLNSIGSAGLVIFFIVYIHRFQIIPEQRALERVFGQAFIDYKNQVRPWL